MKTDLQLRQEVLSRLELEPKIDPAKFGVSVENGVVTLKGNVETDEDRASTWRAVRFIRGVKGLVTDDLQVNSARPALSRDADLQAAASDAIQWLTTIPRESIVVTARNGWLTLEGDVENRHQSQFVEKIISEVPGVRGVKNALNITAAKQAA